MNKENIFALLAGVSAWLLFPIQMGNALGIMAFSFSLVYFGYKGLMQVAPLSSPFRAYFAAVIAQAFIVILFGFPDSDKLIGKVFLIGVPILISFCTVKLFYAFDGPTPKVSVEPDEKPSNE